MRQTQINWTTDVKSLCHALFYWWIFYILNISKTNKNEKKLVNIYRKSLYTIVIQKITIKHLRLSNSFPTLSELYRNREWKIFYLLLRCDRTENKQNRNRANNWSSFAILETPSLETTMIAIPFTETFI